MRMENVLLIWLTASRLQRHGDWFEMSDRHARWIITQTQYERNPLARSDIRRTT